MARSTSKGSFTDGTPPRVSILIPAAAPVEVLFAGLEALERHAPAHIPLEVILVLSVPLAPAAEKLQRRFPDLRIVTPAVTLGLAAAANRARVHARGELLVLLHDDTEVEPGWLEGLVAAADEHPEAGAIGSLVLELDGRLQSAGAILWRDGWTSSSWTGAVPEPGQFARSRAVDYCGTSSLLVRATTWDAIGGLDERYFPLYYVDVDLAMAVRRLGQTVRFDPRSRLRHHRGTSTEPDFRTYVLHRNQGLFVEKWGEDLARFDPPGRESFDAVAATLARADSSTCERAATLRQLPMERPAFDAPAQDMRQLALAAELDRDWANELARRAAASRTGP